MAAKKILVVDDDPEMRTASRIRLTASGYKVVSAVDGVSAMSQARKEKPDLILLDLGIPSGDGYMVLERLKASEILSSIPVVVVSGRDETVNRGKAMTAGAEAFLQKPVLNATLLSTIDLILGRSSAVATTISESRSPTSF